MQQELQPRFGIPCCSKQPGTTEMTINKNAAATTVGRAKLKNNQKLENRKTDSW